MTSGCLDRKEVRGAIWGVHSTTDRPASGNTGRLFLAFGGPVCADRISNCPLDRVLTYKNLIYLLNLQIYLGFYVAFNTVQVISRRVVGRAEETSTFSSLGFCTVNCQPTASNYQLFHLRPFGKQDEKKTINVQ